MYISRSYSTLLAFGVASLSLNNCFNVPGKRCVQIIHHLHRYEMPFLWLSYHKSRLHGFFCWSLLFSSVHVWSIISKWDLAACQIFQCGNGFNQTLLWWTRFVASSSVMLKNVSSSNCSIKLFFSNWKYLAYFKLPSILASFLELSLSMYPRSIWLLPSNFTVFVV